LGPVLETSLFAARTTESEHDPTMFPDLIPSLGCVSNRPSTLISPRLTVLSFSCCFIVRQVCQTELTTICLHTWPMLHTHPHTHATYGNARHTCRWSDRAPPAGKCVLLTDQGGADASFLLHHFVGLHLRAGHKVCSVFLLLVLARFLKHARPTSSMHGPPQACTAHLTDRQPRQVPVAVR
jgi:hypothetical protein